MPNKHGILTIYINIFSIKMHLKWLAKDLGIDVKNKTLLLIMSLKYSHLFNIIQLFKKLLK